MNKTLCFSFKSKSMSVKISQHPKFDRPFTWYSVTYPDGKHKAFPVWRYDNILAMEDKICERMWELTGGEAIEIDMKVY